MGHGLKYQTISDFRFLAVVFPVSSLTIRTIPHAKVRGMMMMMLMIMMTMMVILLMILLMMIIILTMMMMMMMMMI